MSEALHRTVPSVDVVHTHLPFIFPTLAASRAAFRSAKPLIYHQHGVLDPDHLKFRSLKKRIYITAFERRAGATRGGAHRAYRGEEKARGTVRLA